MLHNEFSEKTRSIFIEQWGEIKEIERIEMWERFAPMAGGDFERLLKCAVRSFGRFRPTIRKLEALREAEKIPMRPEREIKGRPCIFCGGAGRVEIPEKHKLRWYAVETPCLVCNARHDFPGLFSFDTEADKEFYRRNWRIFLKIWNALEKKELYHYRVAEIVEKMNRKGVGTSEGQRSEGRRSGSLKV